MKTQLDYKALDATRDERLRRIAEALARPMSGTEWPPILTDQEIDEHIRATEDLPFAKTSDERRAAFRAQRDALVRVSHDDSKGEAHAG